MATKPKNPEHVRKGELIRRRREIRGLTQEQVAQQVRKLKGEGSKFNTRTVQNVESGTTHLSRSVGLILEVLDMSNDDLFDGPEPSAEAKRLADQDIWASFPDDVQTHLIWLGDWLASFPPLERKVVVRELSKHMRERKTNG